jgi:Heterokaryon incompatibility protein (HET)
MRLLYLEGEDSLRIEQFEEGSIPPYVILSHTWSRYGYHEVTFEDVERGTYHHKEGFLKVKFCGLQARAHGFRYFWVDTCCIKTTKQDHSERDHAIASMFNWYKNAAKCFVYLSDVSKARWKSDFRRSRWFTRGWTLQELLAPEFVEFYSEDGHRLGSKVSLRQRIHKITGIPIRVLLGENLDSFSKAERFRWMKDRKTKKKEDRIYCLLGIFGVSIDMVYGIGLKRARFRLKEEIGRNPSISFRLWESDDSSESASSDE